MRDTPRLGPIALCTVTASDGAAVVEAYEGWLHQQVVSCGELDTDTAHSLGFPQFIGLRHWCLANAVGHQWLQILEVPDAEPRDSLHTYGWLAMEVLVEDVDALADSLSGSPFELLRPPADLDVSDQIRACQVRGPAGEVLYLTQVNGEVPPFELPRCQAPVDHLFIPVLSSPSRDASLSEYSEISGNPGISFETKITVVNQARNFDLERRHPVATLQLAGNALIEIDQIAESERSPTIAATGMISVAFHCHGPASEQTLLCRHGPFAGHRTQARVGCAGEHYTLVYS